MGMPGEVPQEVGRAYVKVLVGCLEITVRGFRREFEVYTAPEKLTFQSPSGESYSFDVLGRFRRQPYDCEVLIESKGYKDGGNLLVVYEDFLAKSYVTSLHVSRHRNDSFWFVTNVPFGSSIGRKLTSPKFIEDRLTRGRTGRLGSILGEVSIDTYNIASLSQRISVCILTESYIQRTGVYYPVEQDDNVWDIVKLLHAGKIPTPYFRPIEEAVAKLNKLSDPNLIVPGRRLCFPWYGIEWD